MCNVCTSLLESMEIFHYKAKTLIHRSNKKLHLIQQCREEIVCNNIRSHTEQYTIQHKIEWHLITESRKSG